MKPISLLTIVFGALALGLLLMLSGCTTAASYVDTAAEDNATCVSWGTAPGSDAYVSCRAQQQNARLVSRSIAVEESYVAQQNANEFAANLQRAFTGTSPYSY